MWDGLIEEVYIMDISNVLEIALAVVIGNSIVKLIWK